MLRDRVIDVLILAGCETVVVAGVKIVAVPSEIGKIGKPLPADKTGFSSKELPVNAPPAPGDRAFPLPRAVRLVRKPQPWRAKIFHGKAGNIPGKKGQKARLLCKRNDVLRASQLRKLHEYDLLFLYVSSDQEQDTTLATNVQEIYTRQVFPSHPFPLSFFVVDVILGTELFRAFTHLFSESISMY